MTKRLALNLFVLAVLLIAVAYASVFLPGESPAWAPWLMAAGTCLSLVSMMAVGAARHGRIGPRLAAAFGLVVLIVGGGFAILLALPAADPADPSLWLGLPPRAAVLLYGVGLLPFFIVPVAYAWTFDAFTLSEVDLERVRRAGRESKAAADALAAEARAAGDTGARTTPAAAPGTDRTAGDAARGGEA